MAEKSERQPSVNCETESWAYPCGFSPLRADQPADRLRCASSGGPYPLKQRVNFSHGEDGRLHVGSVT
jgi:hypothetical protein